MLPPLQAAVVPKAGLVIAQSAKVRPGTYALAAPEGPALTIRGDGITVDLTGVTLRGTPATAWPDAREGLGVLVEGRNVVVKGLHAHGYRIALLAQGVKGLKLIDCDLSYNWKGRLRSTPEREDAADWMSFHDNERGQWRRQGVGADLERCDGFEVRGLRVTGGQSGLFLDRSNGGLVWNCDLSYNSALGIGMYRASGNRIMHNRLDYDVRGFSYGVYNRGQDSAAILVFEQSNRNVFAYNSATHGGDGFFLWAGLSTMETGKGGCDDNLVFANDFSHAPTNGIEATFSRNAFVGNRVHGSYHGFWGGYSHDTAFIGNSLAGNQRGIAIEHGQANDLSANTFDRDDVAIALWADPVGAEFAYAKGRDVRSRDNRIVGNLFRDVPLALDLKGTTNTLFSENLLDGVARPLRAEGEPFPPLPVTNTLAGSTPDGGLPGIKDHIRIQRAEIAWDPLKLGPETAPFRVAPLKGGRMPFLAKGARQGWSTILVDEWGPYDGRRPILWPERRVGGAAPAPGGTSAGSGTQKPTSAVPTGRYRILGPKGRWRLVRAEGVRTDVEEGAVPGFVTLDFGKAGGSKRVELEYVGAATVDVRGLVTSAGKPVRFGLSRTDGPPSATGTGG